MLTSKKNGNSEDAIVNAIAEFHYMPEEVAFSLYFHRYQNLYKTDCTNWNNHKKFVNYTLPKKTSDLTFKETVTVLLKVFSPKTLLFLP